MADVNFTSAASPTADHATEQQIEAHKGLPVLLGTALQLSVGAEENPASGSLTGSVLYRKIADYFVELRFDPASTELDARERKYGALAKYKATTPASTVEITVAARNSMWVLQEGLHAALGQIRISTLSLPGAPHQRETTARSTVRLLGDDREIRADGTKDRPYVRRNDVEDEQSEALAHVGRRQATAKARESADQASCDLSATADAFRKSSAQPFKCTLAAAHAMATRHDGRYSLAAFLAAMPRPVPG